MDKDLNFLKKLRDHSVKPADSLYEAIKHRIDDESDTDFTGILAQLKDHIAEPPPTVTQSILDRIANNKFSADSGLASLSDHVVKPPEHLFDQIKKASLSTGKAAPVVAFAPAAFRRYAIPAAAGLLFCILAGVVYKNFKASSLVNNQPVASVNTNAHHTAAGKAAEGTTGLPGIAAIASPNAAKERVAEKNGLSASRSGKSAGIAGKKSATGIEPTQKTVAIRGVVIPFVDNDFFSTFTSFNYLTTDIFKNVPDGKAITVRLNNYSAIDISPKMQAMMKKMYKVKRNGKATFAARRLQKKLLKWKSDDKEAFDTTNAKDPLDIIDLFEFLLER